MDARAYIEDPLASRWHCRCDVGQAAVRRAADVLTFRKEFKTGASYYGISDLEALAKDTHKFESRYLDGLVGPYPERKAASVV
jgi:hypothetical protein